MSTGKGRRLTHVEREIKGLFGALQLEERQIIAACWQKKYAAMARHTRLEELANGKLKVTVDSSVWLQQTRLMREEIKKELNKKLKKEVVKEIQLKVGNIKQED